MNIRSTLIIRYTISALFLWFGFAQLLNPENWILYLPEWTGYFPIPASMLISWNGWVEVILSVLLFVGLHTRIVSALLGIHLTLIALSIGGALGVRDTALGIITIAIALSPSDRYTLDQHNKFKIVATEKR